MRCPLGAHYLPVPGPAAVEVIELLDELGVRRVEDGRAVYDERMLCHTPQERLFIDGGWRDGLLPPVEALPAAERAPTLAQYRAFAAAVAAAAGADAFAIPTTRSRWSDSLAALDRVTVRRLARRQGPGRAGLALVPRLLLPRRLRRRQRRRLGLGGPALLREPARLSRPRRRAHARRRRSGVLTWPEGNAWLAERLAAPLGDRLHPGRVVARRRRGARRRRRRRLERGDRGSASAGSARASSSRRRSSSPRACSRRRPRRCARPRASSAMRPGWSRTCSSTPRSTIGRARRRRGTTSPTARAASATSTRCTRARAPFAGPTVLTAYVALGAGGDAALVEQRRRLLADDWRTWAEAVVADLAPGASRPRAPSCAAST